MKEYTPEDILLAREKRVEFQEELIKSFKLPLLTMRVNYPGVNKLNDLTSNITAIMEEELKRKLKGAIVYKILTMTAEGPVITMILRGDAFEIKKNAVFIEEGHPLGRFVDIDAYNLQGRSISRTEIGKSHRKCYICDDMAQNCVRDRKHSKEEIVGYMEKKYDEFIEFIHGENI